MGTPFPAGSGAVSSVPGAMGSPGHEKGDPVVRDDGVDAAKRTLTSKKRRRGFEISKARLASESVTTNQANPDSEA
jgi:hypothetical protein